MSEKINSLSLPEASPQDISDLYTQTTRLFDAKQDEAVITPDQEGILQETLEIPSANGKKLRLYRERPSLVDDPTQIDREAPLEQYDEHGETTYHTPVGIEVYDEVTNARLHDFEVESGKAVDFDRSIDETTPDEIINMRALEAKELTALLEQVLENHAAS